MKNMIEGLITAVLTVGLVLVSQRLLAPFEPQERIEMDLVTMNGVVAHLVLVNQQLTEIRSLETQLARATVAVQAKDEALLKTPKDPE